MACGSGSTGPVGSDGAGVAGGSSGRAGTSGTDSGTRYSAYIAPLTFPASERPKPARAHQPNQHSDVGPREVTQSRTIGRRLSCGVAIRRDGGLARASRYGRIARALRPPRGRMMNGGLPSSEFRLAELEAVLGTPFRFGSVQSEAADRIDRGAVLRSVRWDCFSLSGALDDIERRLAKHAIATAAQLSAAVAVVGASTRCIAAERAVDRWELVCVCLKHKDSF